MVRRQALARLDTARVELARAASTLDGLVGREGIGGASRTVARLLFDHARYPIVRRRRRSERFAFLTEELPYTFARYNSTFRNERSVEISVARWFLSAAPVGKMLEVGNVLGHYGIEGHDVLDLYERIRGVINEDIVDFVATEPYDTIVSISTLEHVGRDEAPEAPERAIAAFDRLDALVARDGRILVTIPLGYNGALDEALASGRVDMPVHTVLRRLDTENRWAEASLEQGLASVYGSPFNNANAVYVGMRNPGIARRPARAARA